ncbi:E3 ubiquitin-protein ligase RHA1B-like [Athalia rosae]|uniref:E3 ubiquitin-protein ligase RHA1B-like n=1 Tax=Athalia rosae TaxID=37344 RepID=UPI0020334699|nr:E3 ubiquitin-protein ligase RHA1B-like [Athalia rosae]
MAYPGIIFAAAIAVGLALWYFLADPSHTEPPHESRAPPSRESSPPTNNSWEQSTNTRRRFRRIDNEGKDDCPICTDPMDQAATSLSCGHMFHTLCIQKWRKIQTANHIGGNTCPICRSLI